MPENLQGRVKKASKHLFVIFCLFLSEYCDLDKDRGPCRNYTVWWYFDREYGGCSRFWYGGCDGNKNRFKTKEECQGICVEPVGEGIIKVFFLLHRMAKTFHVIYFDMCRFIQEMLA